MAKVTSLNVNGKKMIVDVDATVSLLAVLRNDLDLTGSKYGCGEGQCGACTVLLDGAATRSCITQVGRAAGKLIATSCSKVLITDSISHVATSSKRLGSALYSSFPPLVSSRSNVDRANQVAAGSTNDCQMTSMRGFTSTRTAA